MTNMQISDPNDMIALFDKITYRQTPGKMKNLFEFELKEGGKFRITPAELWQNSSKLLEKLFKVTQIDFQIDSKDYRPIVMKIVEKSIWCAPTETNVRPTARMMMKELKEFSVTKDREEFFLDKTNTLFLDSGKGFYEIRVSTIEGLLEDMKSRFRCVYLMYVMYQMRFKTRRTSVLWGDTKRTSKETTRVCRFYKKYLRQCKELNKSGSE